MTPMNVFVTEGNVEIYLSQLHETWSPEDRDRLLRLLVQEEDQMRSSREHIENGERRVNAGRERSARQIVARAPLQDQVDDRAVLILETLADPGALGTTSDGVAAAPGDHAPLISNPPGGGVRHSTLERSRSVD